MDEENTKNINSYTRKIRFYPNEELQILLEKSFNATRFLINNALEQIKLKQLYFTSSSIDIRNKLRYQDKYLEEDQRWLWLKEIPYDTRDNSIRQLCSNFKTIKTQLQKKQIKFFTMKFKSKRTPKQTCYINKKALVKGILFSRRMKYKEKIKFREDISKYTDHGQLTVTRERGKYFMCFPLERKNINTATPYKAVALDPGVRTFQTFYSEEGIVGKIGDNTSNYLRFYLNKEDKLKSKIASDKIVGKTRKNLKHRCHLLRTKVKDIVVDLHRKTCSWLTNNFKYIFLPSFNVKPMIRKTEKRRKLNKITVRSMLSLSHYAFKERLLQVAESKGCIVKICSEAYTSKTCGCCGYVNYNLKGEKIYKCPDCNLQIDRDYNGARNIYLRNTQKQL